MDAGGGGGTTRRQSGLRQRFHFGQTQALPKGYRVDRLSPRNSRRGVHRQADLARPDAQIAFGQPRVESFRVACRLSPRETLRLVAALAPAALETSSQVPRRYPYRGQDALWKRDPRRDPVAVREVSAFLRKSLSEDPGAALAAPAGDPDHLKLLFAEDVVAFG